MIEFSCVDRSLRGLDESHGEVIVCGLYRDVRPFRGVLGQIDYRMLGTFSRLAAKGFLLGDLAETLIVPGRPRISYDKVLCVGLGAIAQFDDHAFASALAAIVQALAGLRARRCSIELPGRANERITPEHALDLLLERTKGEIAVDTISFIEDVDGERRMRERANEERRRARMR